MNKNILNFEKYMRTANYLTVAQIFLQDNFLMERELNFDDVKPRLLGHWGSGPGINFSYMHLSAMAKKYGQEMMFVLGPGHGFPALQANLFLEGSLGKFYPEATHTYDGIGYICRNFSWPYGFPSHSNPGTPGVILEGGELGYALATSYGAAMDNRNMIVACLVGDGEAETGPAAGAWHINKLIDPKTNGTVLPILHLNGYKISGPTVFGRMSDDELKALFWGYGYEPRIVTGDNLHEQMAETVNWAHELIWTIKNDPKTHVAPRLPMIVMRTLKGWTGIKELDGNKIEGNCLSHQVVLTEAKSSREQLKMLEGWLRSYRINELFDYQKGFGGFVKEVLPDLPGTMGMSPHALGGEPMHKPLALPDPLEFAEDASVPGTIGSSSMIRVGQYLKKVFELNGETKNFRLMSPDETYSNKLDAVFEVTSRAWVWPHQPWDKDLAHDGRVMEMLSEHNLQGLMQGYVLTGRNGVFASYEAFIQIVSSMMDQAAKFIKQAKEVSWRGDISSLNYILTSSGWRQDHNGFSHQNPGFIDDALQRHGNFVTVYLPPDGITSLLSIDKMLASKNGINILCAGKTLEPRWLNPELARKQMQDGIMTWDFASDENPDVVLAGIGDYTTKEIMAAIDFVKREWPQARLRCVNISMLTSDAIGSGNAKVSQEVFERHFTTDKPVICNFHGYPEALESILFEYASDDSRFDVRGYVERGSTTTPFDMQVRNGTSRYHLAMAVFKKLGEAGKMPRDEAQRLVQKCQQMLDVNTSFIKKNGVDLPEIDLWQWKR